MLSFLQESKISIRLKDLPESILSYSDKQDIGYFIQKYVIIFEPAWAK